MTGETRATTDDSAIMDCGTAVRMLWDYLDGNLGAREVAAIHAHVNRCSHCFSHADFGQVVIDAVAQVRQSQEFDAPTGLRERVIARLRAEGYQEP